LLTGTGVGVSVGVDVSVGVAVLVGVGVLVEVGVLVGVAVDVSVAVGVLVAVGTGVLVATGRLVGGGLVGGGGGGGLVAVGVAVLPEIVGGKVFVACGKTAARVGTITVGVDEGKGDACEVIWTTVAGGLSVATSETSQGASPCAAAVAKLTTSRSMGS